MQWNYVQYIAHVLSVSDRPWIQWTMPYDGRVYLKNIEKTITSWNYFYATLVKVKCLHMLYLHKVGSGPGIVRGAGLDGCLVLIGGGGCLNCVLGG